MKNELEHTLILKAFDVICRQGKKQTQGYELDGITAYTDFDGYTLYFEARGVFMRFGFHNTYHLDYNSDREKKEFLKKITALSKC
ncbi:MAG: DUF3081 family protein [Shewanellaceae bacterium]|nr:DUF3081 family protein [Shewanellaceae bacterium]